MDRRDVEMLSASLVREYLARKRLVSTLRQLDEEQNGCSTCVRSRLKLMKALRIGKLMKRNKKQDFALDSMVEVIVHFLLEHARDSKGRTKALQSNHQHEHTEDHLIKHSDFEGFPQQSSYKDEISTTEASVEETYDEKVACAEKDGERIPVIWESTNQKKSDVTNLNFMDHDVGESVSLDGVVRVVCDDVTNGTKCVTSDGTAKCNNDLGSHGDTKDQYHESQEICDAKKQSGTETQSGLTWEENSVISQQDHDGSLLEESGTDSDSESCDSSVIDLLRDMADECGNEFAVTTDLFKKESAVARMSDLSHVKNGSVDTHIDKANVIFAWMNESDHEVESVTNQTINGREHEKPGEEIEEMEKWASERPEKHGKCNKMTMEKEEEKNEEESDRSSPSEEEVVSGGPSQVGVGTSCSRPGTQESAAHRLLWLHEDSRDGRGIRSDGGGSGSSGKRSPDLLRLGNNNSQATNVKMAHTFDDPLDTYRSGPELKNGLLSPIKSQSNGHIPNGLSNGQMNGHAHRTGNGRSGSVPLAIQGKSVFDTDADVDIATVAAQRDQLRGTRNVRGMMAPVMSKEEDSRSRSANRRMVLNKQRSESILGDHEVSESKDVVFPSSEHRENGNKSDVLGKLVGRRGVGESAQGLGLPLGGLGGIGLRPPGDYLDANRRSDIMAQSIRRQSLRGSKQSLLDSNYSSFESNTSSRLSMGEPSPEEFTVFQPDGGKYPKTEEGYSEAKRKNLPKFIPSSHEDIQILNLQGFMDASGVMGDGSGVNRRKHKKKRIKRAMEIGHMDKARDTYKFHARPRRKRTHKLSKSLLSDDDGEVMLKDIDDLDNKVAGLVLGPEHSTKESSGRPITLEEASDLRNILTGSPAQPLPTEWLSQNFKQNTNPNLSYGLVQKKGGPCGVLACVQAYMMKCLIFGSVVAPNTSPVSPLRPSQREWSWALAVAITEILWKAGQEQKAVLAMPGSFAHFTEHGIGRYSQDGMTENLTLHEFVEQQDLLEAITRHLTAFTSETSSGCVILLYSLIFTRGIENIHSDMDSGGGHLINAHGYSSQEIVNLLLTGRAFTNTFNGDHTLGNNPGQSVVLHGILHKGEIGLLSLFEHYDCYKVGTYLKSPQYPIWVVCCESHYSCLFSRDTSVTSDMPSVSKFDVYYYDGLSLQEDEIRLTIDLDGDESDLTIVPPLEHCIRTKWKKAAVNWNGTDPIL